MHSSLKSVLLVVVLALPFGALSALAQNQAAHQIADAASRVQPLQQSLPAAPEAIPAHGNSDLIIGNGDLLEVSVYGAPEFVKQARVADSGDISLPLVGSVHVAGLTIREAELALAQRLSDGEFFFKPQVSIFVKEYASQGISVLGEVQKPGIYPLPGDRTLFDALSAAGGVTPKAGNSITVTHRTGKQGSQTVVMPSNETLPPASNVPVMPGDIVVVSKAGIVYVVGDVHLPGGFVLENSNLTVLQAIAMAQGTNSTAKLDRTILIRKTSDGHQEIPIALSQIMAARSPDIKLQPDDIVFVPVSGPKAVARRSLEAILTTATGVVIYRR